MLLQMQGHHMKQTSKHRHPGLVIQTKSVLFPSYNENPIIS